MDAGKVMGTPEKLWLIWKHTHRDYKSVIDGVRHVLVLRQGLGTCLVRLSDLTAAEIEDKLPYALSREAKRVAAEKSV